MSTKANDDTMIVTLRVGDLREILRGVLAELLSVRVAAELLDLKQVAQRYRVGRAAILAAARRGEIELSQGPRRKLLVRAEEVEGWLTRRKYIPPSHQPAKDMAEWEREADRVLERALAAGRLRVMSPAELAEHRARRKQRKRR